jgi:hypothetical protein
MKIGQSAGKNFAYVLGVYLGDGCVTGSPQTFRVNTIDADFAAAIKASLGVISERNVSISVHGVKKSSKPNHSLYCGDVELCAKLVADTGNKQVIPSYVETMPRECQHAFIVGLMDSEGFVAKKSVNVTGRAYYMGYKSCDVWVPSFVRLLEKNGLRLGKVSECPPYKVGYKTPTRFHIKMQSWVDSGMRFNIARKQDRVDSWQRTEPYSERSRYPRRLTSETTRSTP